MSEFYTSENELEKKHSERKSFKIMGIVFFTLGIIIQLGIVLSNISSNSSSRDGSNQLEYAFGRIIGMALVLSFLIFIVRFIFKKKKNLAVMILSILFLFSSISSASNAISQRRDENRLNNLGKDKFINMARDYTEGKTLTPENFKKSDYGSMAPFLKLTEQYFISCKKLNISFKSQIDSINFETILAPDTFSSSDKIKAAQARLNPSISEFDQLESDINKLVKNMHSDISKLDIPKDFKEGIIAGFENAQVKSGDNIKNYIQAEKNIINKMEEILSFMLSEEGNFQVKDNKIYFYSNDAMSKYNRFVDDLQQLASQETSIKNKITDSMNQKLNEMEKSK